MNSNYERSGSRDESTIFFVPFILRNCNNLFCIWYLVCWNGRSALSNQEVVAGKPLAEFLRHEILEPLQLTETFFQVPLDRQDDLAALYKREPWHGSSSLSGIEMIDFCGFFSFSGIFSDLIDIRRILFCRVS